MRCTCSLLHVDIVIQSQYEVACPPELCTNSLCNTTRPQLDQKDDIVAMQSSNIFDAPMSRSNKCLILTSQWAGLAYHWSNPSLHFWNSALECLVQPINLHIWVGLVILMFKPKMTESVWLRLHAADIRVMVRLRSLLRFLKHPENQFKCVSGENDSCVHRICMPEGAYKKFLYIKDQYFLWKNMYRTQIDVPCDGDMPISIYMKNIRVRKGEPQG